MYLAATLFGPATKSLQLVANADADASDNPAANKASLVFFTMIFLWEVIEELEA